MRIGIVGLGYWGSKHVRVLSTLSDVDDVVVHDANASRMEVIAAAFPSVRQAPSLEALLASVDGLVIATQPSSHATIAREALARGVHVLVEKPLALASDDARQLVAMAAAARTTLMVGHTFAYNPAVRALRDLIRRGELGDVLHVDSERLNLGLYQSDCDVLWDLAPHDISIVNSITGTSPTSVRCWGRGHIDRSVTDNAYLMLDYEETGTQAVVHVSWLSPHRVRRLTVVGSQRMAVFDDLANDERLRVFDKGVTPAEVTQAHDQPMTYRYGDIHAPYIPFQEPLLLEDQHFVECIRTGNPPLTGGEAGLDVVRTLEAASVSLQTGTEVRLDEINLADAHRAHPPVLVLR
ncbi:Gfo/Idh/MocA family oxidoreductase [Kineococcus sp. NPDC059986]|uniref:Gfo/Idh/MocA family protein n=1 Tax=Kineococcus sp. NPDC059986 TaxID=3155538 RepID=UPI00345104C2